MKERIVYFDILRGIAIIGVVAIHSFGINCEFNYGSNCFIGTVIWKQLINFSVPLFLAISGYFSGNKKIDSKNDYYIYLKKHLLRVLIPYILWSILYLGFHYYAHGISLSEAVIKFFTFQTSYPFYFILLIIKYYLLLPILLKLGNKKGLLFSAAISIITCSIIFFIRYYSRVNIPFIIYGGFCPTWIIFFVLGIYLRRNKVKISTDTLFTSIIIFFVLSIFETFLSYHKFHNLENAITSVKLSSFAYSVTVILFLFKFAENNIKRSKILSYLGEISFGIFFTHMLVLRLLNFVLKTLISPGSSATVIYQIAIIVITILCCSLFVYIARKINKKIAIKYFGL